MRPEDAQRSPADQGRSSPSKSKVSTPTIQSAKGGGARGIGEKFAANPVSGTGSVLENIYSGAASSGRYSRSMAPRVLGPEDLHRHG